MICGKVIYKSQTEANHALKGKNKKSRPGKPINRLNTSYFCNDCSGWHIASKSEKRKKGIRAPKTAEDIHSLQRQSRKRKSIDRSVLIIRNYTSKPL